MYTSIFYLNFSIFIQFAVKSTPSAFNDGLNPRCDESDVYFDICGESQIGQNLSINHISLMSSLILIGFLIGTFLFLFLFSSLLGYIKIPGGTLHEKFGIYYDIVKYIVVYLLFAALILYNRPIIRPVSIFIILLFSVVGMIIFIYLEVVGFTSNIDHQLSADSRFGKHLPLPKWVRELIVGFIFVIFGFIFAISSISSMDLAIFLPNFYFLTFEVRIFKFLGEFMYAIMRQLEIISINIPSWLIIDLEFDDWFGIVINFLVSIILLLSVISRLFFALQNEKSSEAITTEDFIEVGHTGYVTQTLISSWFDLSNDSLFIIYCFASILYQTLMQILILIDFTYGDNLYDSISNFKEFMVFAIIGLTGLKKIIRVIIRHN